MIPANRCDFFFLSETMRLRLYLDNGGKCSHGPVLSLIDGCCANTLIMIKNCIYYYNKFHLKPFHFYLRISHYFKYSYLWIAAILE